MDWKKIKEDAKAKISGKLWDIWKPTLLIGLISGVISALATGIFGEESMSAALVTSLFSILLIPAEIGYTSYVMKLTRGENYDLNELKAFYSKFGVIILLEIIMSVLICLASLLFVIPGIILALAYSMALYIFIDNPELSATDYLKKSREMMKGYKGNYFCFGLSFIGWILLCCLVIPMIWVVPYVTVAMVEYYDELKKKTEN